MILASKIRGLLLRLPRDIQTIRALVSLKACMIYSLAYGRKEPEQEA
jgi:hypothetical protein